MVKFPHLIKLHNVAEKEEKRFVPCRHEAVKLLKKNIPQTEIAKKLGCSQPQISSISKNRDAIQAEFESCSNPELKRHRSGKAPVVESALKEWFSNARSKDIPISTNILQEKAEDLASKMKITDFSATGGWLSRWKHRNNIGFKKMHGEKKDADQEAADQWINNILPQLLETYSPENVYNADETGIYYRALPDGTLTFKTDKIAGSKKAKDRVTVLVCANMDGSDKQKLMVIGKSRDPRCFRGIKSLPVTYQSSSNAWMTSDIFREWLKMFNKEMVRKNKKVVLLVDNCSAHPKDAADRLSNVKLEFLPSNTTSVIQPCDQGIIRNLKTLYRTRVVKKIIRDIDNVTSATAIARKLTLLDAVHLLSRAWKDVKISTIINCYRKAGFAQDPADEEEEEINIPDGLDKEQFLNYVESDCDLECHRQPTDDDICSQFTQFNQEDNGQISREADSEDEDEEMELPPSSTEAKEALSLLRRYLEVHGCDDFNDFYSLEDKCESVADNLKTQRKITEFIHWIP
jgi:hypothetical protein